MIEDNKPVHWPPMVKEADESTEQTAIKSMATVRAQIAEFHAAHDRGDWREHHAKTAPIVDVVGGLLADYSATDADHDRMFHAHAKMERENEKLREELEAAKRPFSAQMEMQNRRIIDLNQQLMLAEAKLDAYRHRAALPASMMGKK